MRHTVMERSVLVLAALSLLAGGCGGPGSRVVVKPRQVDAASGSPSVKRVTDMGDIGAIPASGNKLPRFDTDGVFVVGELVHVQGSDFGKQPTVNIGGRPAVVMARTGNGGIVTRIPPGVPTGSAEVEVSHTRGRGARKIDIRRYGFAVQPESGKVKVFALAADGAVAEHGTLEIPGARDVAFSSDGLAAFVVADAPTSSGRANLAVIATTTGGGPKVVRSMRLRGREASFVAFAASAPVAVVVGGGYLTAIDARDARNPSLYDGFALGPKVGEVVAVAIDPDGRLAALLTARDNAIVPIDLSAPSRPIRGDAVSLVPAARVPLVADLGFAPEGKEVWVLAGDNRESLVAGAHPARLLVVSVQGSALALKGEAVVAGADAPTALAVARRESIIGATAIRSTARRVAVVVAGVSRDILKRMIETGKTAAELVAEPLPLGQLVRTDLEGKGQVIWSEEAYVSDVEMTHDVRWLVSATTRVKRTAGATAFEFGVLVLSLSGGKAKFFALGNAGRALLGRGAIALSP